MDFLTRDCRAWPGQIHPIARFRHVGGCVLAPFTCAAVISALIFSFLALGEIPTIPMLGGAGPTIGCGAAIMPQDGQLGMQGAAEVFATR